MNFFVSGERRNQDVLGQSVLEAYTNIKRQRFRFGLHPPNSRTQRARAPPTPRPAAIRNPANTATDFVCFCVYMVLNVWVCVRVSDLCVWLELLKAPQPNFFASGEGGRFLLFFNRILMYQTQFLLAARDKPCAAARHWNFR